LDRNTLFSGIPGKPFQVLAGPLLGLFLDPRQADNS